MRYTAMAHVRSGRLLCSMTDLVRTEKYRLQSRQRYGCGGLPPGM